MEPHIISLLQSEKYARRAATLEAEIARITEDLGSTSDESRLQAGRALNRLARAELSWMLLPVRNHFLDPAFRDVLDPVLSAADDRTRVILLNTMRNAYERHIVHPMWGDLRGEDHGNWWNEWLHSTGETYVENSDLPTRCEAAYLLALTGDPRGWETYLEIVPKRSAMLGQLELAILLCPDSRTPALVDSILALADEAERRHPKQAITAQGIRDALGAGRRD
ncbi:hypothetical protein [Mycetocola saprophilus]|uniref:hypothetical protein n=1 Tax=Mycetocola saprophilus TaxID=76636 RepID=UPI003BF118DB